MSDCDNMCNKCDRKPCIELKPKMAAPKELQTDYGTMVTVNLLMAVSIDSLERKNDQLKAENAKLWELVDELCPLADYGVMDMSELDRVHDLMRELGIEVDG